LKTDYEVNLFFLSLIVVGWFRTGGRVKSGLLFANLNQVDGEMVV